MVFYYVFILHIGAQSKIPAELRAAYEKVQHHQDGNRIAKVLKFKSHCGLGRVDLPLLYRDVAMLKQQTWKEQ